MRVTAGPREGRTPEDGVSYYEERRAQRSHQFLAFINATLLLMSNGPDSTPLPNMTSGHEFDHDLEYPRGIYAYCV